MIFGLIVRMLVTVLVTVAMHGYFWVRLVRDTALPPRARRAATTLLVVLAASSPLALLRPPLVPTFAAPLPVVFAWWGVCLLLFFSLLLAEVVRLAFWLRARARDGGAPRDPERRRTLERVLGGGAAALGLGTAAAGIVEAKRLVVQRVRAPLAKLPAAMSGFRIVQVSDLHIGASLDRGFVAHVVEMVNALEPDLVAITGDLVDGSVSRVLPELEPLRHLSARRGVFFVTGNHEYYTGMVPAWLEALSGLGIRPLHNERVAIETEAGVFDLAGVDDWTAHRYKTGHGHDLGKALAGRDREREVVLLAHQPRAVREAADAGVGLQLSGHTHGGQIFPLGFFLFGQPFVAGLHKMKNTLIYVSRGAGYWGPPMRVGAPPEIAEITLVRA